MKKYCKVNLDFQPMQIDKYAEFFLIVYAAPMHIVDLFQKTGIHYQRFNIQKALNRYKLKLKSLTKVFFPRIKWSDRQIEQMEKLSKMKQLKNIVIVGECLMKNDEEEEAMELLD